MAFAVALIQSAFGADEQDVEVAILVVVQKRAPVADGLENIQGALARDLPAVVESGTRRDSPEDQAVCRRCRGFLGGGHFADRRRQNFIAARRQAHTKNNEGGTEPISPSYHVLLLPPDF